MNARRLATVGRMAMLGRMATVGRMAMLAGMMTLAAQGATHLLHHPAMNRTKIVFSYAGDLWSVGREGGSAVRLTAGAGIESEPVLSPDGETIAFTGEYDGNVDVYTMPVAGGVPKRITFHPGPDAAVAWTPDGKRILIRSGRNSRKGYGRYTNLFVVSPGGGLPEMLPLPLAFSGAYSADGKQMVYAPLDGGQFLRTPERWVAWKRYRGGMASYLWQVNLGDLSMEKIPRTDSNDINPMWVGGKVYFLSDRKGAMTLYRYDGGGKAPVEAIANTGADIRNAQAGPGGIVYEQFGQILIFDAASGKSRAVPITIDADLGEVRARLQNVSSEIANAGLSATGVRAVFEAHGEILTVPGEKGDIRNLTRTPGVMEREPAWSPDGQWIAYFSDEGHEYALHVKAQSGEGEVKKIALAGKSAYYRLPVWSPDSKHIAFRDNQLHVWRVEIATGKLTLVDTEPYVVSLPEMEAVAWSPDSQWLAYGRPVKNLFSAVFLHSVATGKSIQVTDGMSDARFPAFDREGKYLYFTSSTNAGPALSGLDMTSDEHEVTRAVYAAVLAADGKPPLGPESDEEKPRSEEGEKKKEAGAIPVVRVDVDGLGTRMAALPVPVRSWTRLACAQDGSLLLLEGPDAMTALRGGGTAKLSRYDMKGRKLTMLAEGVEEFALSADGAKMLLQLKGEGGGAGRWVIAGALEPLKPGQKDLQVARMEVEVDPRAEWKQMFREVWRIERSFFYDANLHGLNAVESEERYATYLESLAARDDLNYIFQEMLGPMTAGHLRGGGGTVPRGKQVKTGLLGADFAIENGRYRIRKIYSGGLWTPEVKSPLSGAGIDVKEGDYLLAVEGRELAATDNLFEMLAGTVGRQIALRVAADASGAGARVVRVEPVEDEQLLRRYTWMEENRKKVEELSGGRLGYVHLPDTAYGGLTHFNRYYFAQADKDGMILDERMNNGGQVADYIIDVLRRPVQSWGAPRYGLPLKSPGASNQGPKVMIIDELAGSGGDMLPWMFRYAKLGPLVGKRTWGGLIGISAFPTLMDGGRVTAPNFRLYSNEGEWIAENTGVAPDVEVELDPKLMAAGHDAQLERAVALAMEALRRNPPVQPKQPPYPDFNKAGNSGAGGKGGR